MTDQAAEVVYLIGGPSSSRAKIGRATDAKRRLRTIQAMSPVKLEILWTHPGGAALESAFHEHFRDRRAHGEWFDFGSAENAKTLVAAALPAALRSIEELRQAAADQAARRLAREARQAARLPPLDRHLNRGLTVRPDVDALEGARLALAERSLPMGEFITACLNRLVAEPDEWLAYLAPRLPKPGKRGRPLGPAATDAERPTLREGRA